VTKIPILEKQIDILEKWNDEHAQDIEQIRLNIETIVSIFNALSIIESLKG
jgi:hypothetical protein